MTIWQGAAGYIDESLPFVEKKCTLRCKKVFAAESANQDKTLEHQPITAF
jgi:hypothetical protein